MQIYLTELLVNNDVYKLSQKLEIYHADIDVEIIQVKVWRNFML